MARSFLEKYYSGGFLLSHPVARAVPSALLSLTSVCEMGTGGSSVLAPPENKLVSFYNLETIENENNSIY